MEGQGEVLSRVLCKSWDCLFCSDGKTAMQTSSLSIVRLMTEGEVQDKLRTDVNHSLSCNRSRRRPAPQREQLRRMSLKGSWTALSVAWEGKSKTEGLARSGYMFKGQIGQAQASLRL